MSGWYKQQRNRSERPWFKNAKAAQLYDYLKDVAYVSDSQYQGRLIRRGSCPTTRAEMMEATGQTYAEIRNSLKMLEKYGEIIVRGSNQFTVITVCDYDACGASATLFDDYYVQRGSNGGLTGVQRESNGGLTPHINIKEGRIEDNLVSPYSPYKKERETREMALEIKKRYNKMFDGVLPPCIRLTLPTRLMVEECVSRFGMQAVDLVLAQVKSEPFARGGGKGGFIANFQFIFEPNNFQQYLERAMLRQKKQQEKPVAKVDEHVADVPRRQSRREFLAGWAEAEAKNPTEWGRTILRSAYESGELKELGIDWKPNDKF